MDISRATGEGYRARARRLLRIAEAAEMLGVSRTTLYAMLAAGEIPAVRLAGRRATRIDPEDLEAYIARNKVGGGA